MKYDQSIVVTSKDVLWVDTDHPGGSTGTMLCFELKGSNDAMITLRCKPEVNAQDASPDTIAKPSVVSRTCTDETPLTLVLGSHRNTKLKLCYGNECHVLRKDISESLLDPKRFKTFWIWITETAISLGCGPRGCACILNHPVGVPTQRLFIGFLSLDCPVIFRSIRLAPPPTTVPCAPEILPTHANTLSLLCLDAVADSLTVDNICSTLLALHSIWRSTGHLWAKCVHFLAVNFTAVLLRYPCSICSLPADALIETLACGRLNAQELTLFCAAESWALSRPLSRACCTLLSQYSIPESPSAPHHLAQSVHDVQFSLEYIRFPLMTLPQLNRARMSPLWSLIGDPHSSLTETVLPCKSSTAAVAVPSAFPAVDHRDGSGVRPPGGAIICRPEDLKEILRRQRRAPPHTLAELQFVRPGDKNGMIHYLGTKCGTRKTFINPHLTEVVQISSSSPFCTDSDGSKLTSRAYHGSTCAIANSAGQAFWQVDLRDHTLLCLQYVLRVNDSKDFPRTWSLQGSSNGEGWTDLHSVKDCGFFQKQGQTGVWQIHNPVLQFFSCFRICMSSAVQGGLVFNVNFLEFYGYVSHTSGG